LNPQRQRKIEKNDDFEIQNLQVRDVLVDPTGIFFSCEEYWVEDHSYYANNSWHCPGHLLLWRYLWIKIGAVVSLNVRKIPKDRRVLWAGALWDSN
jgi:hypothetical protein